MGKRGKYAKWTAVELETLRALAREHGPRNWPVFGKSFQGKTMLQVRYRLTKLFPEAFGSWNNHQTSLLKVFVEMGLSWRHISKCFDNTFTPAECKNRFSRYFPQFTEEEDDLIRQGILDPKRFKGKNLPAIKRREKIIVRGTQKNLNLTEKKNKSYEDVDLILRGIFEQWDCD